MTDKEIARFKVKFPKINLSAARLAAYKLSLADDADDAAIDGKLDEVNGIFPFEEIAKADDRARTPPKPAPAPAPGPDPAPADPAPADDPSVPAWAKTLIDQNKALADKVAAIESGKSTETRKTQLGTVLKDVPDAYRKTIEKNFDRMSFQKDEEFDTWLEEIKTDSAEMVQAEANSVFSRATRPTVPAGGNTKQASKEDVKKVFG